MAVTLDQFLAAERQQESGGDYSVVNSIGALGAYQVMTGNLPSWSRAALGHSVSVQEYLSHPAEQDAVARYELGPVFNSKGPAAAAAWWYSGQTDPTKRYGNPPVYQYVQEVLSKIGKAGTVTGGKNGTSATPADNVSGSSVTTAGLQTAGYEAVIDLTPFGIPINPFKIPGWLAGKLAGGGSDGSGGSLLGGIGQGMWDAVGPIVLSGLGIAAGAGAILIGLYVTAKPAVDHAKDQAVSVASTAAEAAPLAAL